MTTATDDPRIDRGMAAQLAARRERIAAGEKPIGWKVGFGTQAAMQRFGLAAPLVGFLTARGLVPSGGTVSLAGWERPAAEPEIAVQMGRDLGADADEAAARAAISALAPAIELVDPDPAVEDVTAILAGNVFHRHVIFGAAGTAFAGGNVEGLTGRVRRNGTEAAATSNLEVNAGRIVPIVRYVADLLARSGEKLRAGDLIIAGSVVPPIQLDANDEEIAFDVGPLGSVSVRFGRR
jgi:2-keto-4-pentenoate hydratase